MMEDQEKTDAQLGFGTNGTQLHTESDISCNQSLAKSGTSSDCIDEEVDLMKVFYDKEPKSTDLRISCTICGDKASGFHYGVHACEGCKGFFRRTVRMRLKYKECTAGCKVNVKTRNKCQHCRFQKCIKSGMSHDAIRFGRMSRVEKKKIISKMAREEPELLSRKRFEEEEKMKNLTETLLNAFQEHLSITRAKMVALWQKRDMPGSVAPQISSLEDVKSLYPMLKGNIQEDTDSPTYAAESTSQPYDGNHNPVIDKRSDDALAFAFLEDMSFSSSSSSDSDSDELLHAVKKTTIPYPNYKHEGKLPQLPSLYQETLVSSMNEDSKARIHMEKESCGEPAIGCSGDLVAPDVQLTNSDSCYSSGSEQHDTPPHSSTSSLLKSDLSSLPPTNDLERMINYLPDLKLVFAKAGITLADVTKHAQANNCSVFDSAFQLLRDKRVKIKLEKQLGVNKSHDAPQKSPQKSQTTMQRPPMQMVGLKVMRFLYQRFQKRLVKGVCELTEYSKRIPGFTSLLLSDQVILLKYGSYEALFVLLGAMVFQKGMLLPDGNLFVTYDFVFKLGEVGQMMRPKFEFAEKIASLNLHDKDLALFVAAIILFGDRPGLCDRQKVEDIQSDILRALEVQLKNSHPNNPQLFAKLLLKMTDLRQLVADHVHMTERLDNIRSMKKLFHPLVSELLSDRE